MIGPSVFFTTSLSKNWSLSTTRKGIFHGINVHQARTTTMSCYKKCMDFFFPVPGSTLFIDTIQSWIRFSGRSFLMKQTNPVTWMDYSVNIKLTEKQQAQSAHFSGKQQTLHDSLIQYPNKHFHYIYHISNDTNHDSVMTTQVVEGILMNHPEFIQSGRFSLRSANCSTQYKSRYVFKSLLNIAEKYNIRIDFFMVKQVMVVG